MPGMQEDAAARIDATMAEAIKAVDETNGSKPVRSG
jgi:hypothetical protein